MPAKKSETKKKRVTKKKDTFLQSDKYRVNFKSKNFDKGFVINPDTDKFRKKKLSKKSRTI